MKKIFLSVILLLLSIVGTYAQPGYLGNKFSVNVFGDFLPAVRVEDNQNLEGFYLAGIKSTAGFNLSYTLSNKRAVEFRYSTFKDWEGITSYDYEGYIGMEYIKQNSYEIHLKKFVRQSISPLGGYTRIAAGYTRNYVADDIDFTETDVYTGFKVGFGLGKQRILLDKIVIDFGVLAYINVITGTDSGGIFNALDNGFCKRVLFRDHLYVHFGAGYLLF